MPPTQTIIHGALIYCYCLVPQRSCFQLVLLSDYRTSRSYTVFNYNNLQTWATYRSAGEGYQTADGSLLPYNLPVSLTPYFEFLPFIPGNTGIICPNILNTELTITVYCVVAYNVSPNLAHCII